jgi:hypothetical protein
MSFRPEVIGLFVGEVGRRELYSTGSSPKQQGLDPMKVATCVRG